MLSFSDIDCSFFVVTVDLWSADASKEMNLAVPPSRSTPIMSSAMPSHYSSAPVFPAEGPPSWGYAPPQQLDRTTGFPPPTPPSLPSISSFSSSWPRQESEPESYPYRSWNPSDLQYPSQQFPQDSQPSYTSHDMDNLFTQQGSSTANTSYYAAFSSQGVPRPHSPSNLHSGAPAPRHTYTRTLVGPLSSNATRLLDEHRKPGIFFLFQDLSVRTEGTFRLRMRLMNVGAPPAPEPGAKHVHMGVSPILAQAFSEPFTVYSAKRFPGVPDTTALSIALGNQGQKLPLRNRHGSSKSRRPRDGSED
ncbi:velvet factor [Flagelloscypha sp. PMI_526]|nr:velvet factor [Flagelloscypha sp. PMI_526]